MKVCFFLILIMHTILMHYVLSYYQYNKNVLYRHFTVNEEKQTEYPTQFSKDRRITILVIFHRQINLQMKYVNIIQEKAKRKISATPLSG